MLCAIVLLTFLYGLLAGVVLASLDKPKKRRQVFVQQKAPHFYDLKAE